ncbi:MAG: hypothetical protein Q8N18_13925 [Opitutaceae bacterium]|nr:hypothetical protein [Opitutaceae bacterium]
MKKQTPSLSVMLVLGLSLLLSTAVAQTAGTPDRLAADKNPSQKGPAKPYPLKVCIVTDNDLDSMGDETSMVYQGQVIKFCCAPCEKKFLKDPPRFLAKLAPKSAGKK